MVAMILAAGRGERMRPLTDTTPKPLLKVKNKPLIEWHLEKLAKNGFKKVVINIAHLGFMIPQTLGDGSRWGLELIYSDEQQIGGLESAGGIIYALENLSETFLVVNGDVFCDYEFDKSFNLNNKLAHLVLVNNPNHNKDGDFEFQGQKLTFSGIGYYDKKMFKGFDVDKIKLAPILRQNITKQQVSFELFNGLWRDIGTEERLNEANNL